MLTSLMRIILKRPVSNSTVILWNWPRSPNISYDHMSTDLPNHEFSPMKRTVAHRGRCYRGSRRNLSPLAGNELRRSHTMLDGSKSNALVS